MFIYDYNFVRISIVVETELELLDKLRFWIVGRYIVIDSLAKVKSEISQCELFFDTLNIFL